MVQPGEPFVPSIGVPTGQTPLLHFRADLKEYVPEQRSSQDGSRKFMVIQFNFINLEVIESTEPYPFPIAQIGVGYAPPEQSRGGSRWEALASSIRKLAGPTAGLADLVGKRMEWKQLPYKLRQQLRDETGNTILDASGKATWGDVEGPAWMIVSLEGVGSAAEVDAAFDEHLLELADGKSEHEFNTAALADPQVLARPAVIQAITDKKALQPLLDAGRLTRDAEGVLHKAAAPTPPTA